MNWTQAPHARLISFVEAGVFDAMAGQVVHIARVRGWAALSSDPGRLRRIDPALEIDVL